MSSMKLWNQMERGGEGYLAGHLLIATPLLTESCFAHSVVYLCSHNAGGAIGLIVNRSLVDVSYADVFSQLGLGEKNQTDELPFADAPIHFGGPVEPSRGFVLHTSDYIRSETLVLADGLALTANICVLEDLVKGGGPKRMLLALGYAGWSAGQLEKEIEENSWISRPATPDLVFHGGSDDMWHHCARTIGVDLAKLSTEVGHA